MNEFQSKYGPWAVVAGASVGIGEAMAKLMAQRGLNLVIIARRKDVLEKSCAAMRQQYPAIEVRGLPLDLALDDASEQIAAATQDLDVGMLIYNAALAPNGAFWAIDMDRYHQLFNVNMHTIFNLVHHFGPKMMAKRRGGIILTSSMAGQTAQPYLVAYAASKAWNTNFVLSLWGELKPYNVDVLSPIVSATDTPGLKDCMDPTYYKFLTAQKMQTADEVAVEAIKFLGKQPVVVTGKHNRLFLSMYRLMGANRGLKFMINMVVNQIYGGNPPKQPV
jgi:hypothetical protein